MKAPITDTTLGIAPESNGKFRDVRQKARDEYIERSKNKKKKKDVCVPKYKPGDLVVVVPSYSGPRTYILAEVLDFEERWKDEFAYYCLVLKSTGGQDKVGRLIKTSDTGYYAFPRIENTSPDTIKWG